MSTYNRVVAADSSASLAPTVRARLATEMADPTSEVGTSLSGTFASLFGNAEAFVWAGDSLSAQGGGSADSVGDNLATLTGVPCAIDAVGGEASVGIAARLDALPLLINPFTIPASGAVTVTFTTPTGETYWPLLQTAGNPLLGQVWAGSIANIPGTFAMVQPSGVSMTHQATDYYTFTRTTTGTATRVPRSAPFLIDYAATHTGKFYILWSGRNDIAAGSPSIDQMIANVAAMVTKITAEGGDFLVLSVMTGASEGTGVTINTNALAYNARLAALYGRRYFDIRGALINDGLSMVGITPTVTDVSDIASDTVPASLRADSIHLTPSGRAATARLTYEHLQELARVTETAPAQPAVTVILDTFNRGTTADLGPKWSGGGTYTIVSNQLTRTVTVSTPEILHPNRAVTTADMEASVDVVTRGGSTSVGVVVRYVDDNNYIGCRINNGTNVLIYKVIAGATQALAGADSLWASDPARLSLRAVGNTFTAYRDGVSVTSVTHTASEVASAKGAGIRTGSAATKPVLDNFSVADVA